ncbi:hypothetical protein EZV62_020760 [Acer yangbiense]|uniref:FAS1 domain-containing protein n=1 Tax=Acer yangbiense TaxID=1000413 RepID=A0A5C7HET9_9ROSI|nr:hypothetical protein EZV62_020760 [Acer yangbiense]
MAALCFMILVPLFFVVAESQSTNKLNQTELRAAMADMRAKSYHGFVILLKILEKSPNSLPSSDVTFLMPDDDQLSALELNLDHLLNFILIHTIPSPLIFNNMLHFPNGTLVPSSMPGKMISVTNDHGLFFNSARIVSPNVCVNSTIRCHGISSAISFDGLDSNGDAPPDSMDSQKMHAQAKRSPAIHLKRNSPLS